MSYALIGAGVLAAPLPSPDLMSYGDPGPGQWMAARAGHPIGFVEFLRDGIPVTVISLVMATAYVMVRYA